VIGQRPDHGGRGKRRKDSSRAVFGPRNGRSSSINIINNSRARRKGGILGARPGHNHIGQSPHTGASAPLERYAKSGIQHLCSPGAAQKGPTSFEKVLLYYSIIFFTFHYSSSSHFTCSI
jgi:hypothetical protein